VGGSSVLVEAEILAGRAILYVVRRVSKAVSLEVRVVMDIAESELRLERETESWAWSRRKVPTESSSSPNVLRWREGMVDSGRAGACWAEDFFVLTGGKT
jgi:hypothetical protein